MANAIEQPLKSQNPVSHESSNLVGNYLLGKSLGKGTFGKVKLAIHALTGEKVAVKILEKDKIKDKKDIERITREIKILKKVRHPNVIQLYEIIETDTELFLMMEFCQGGELFDYIVQHQRLNEKQACKFYQELIAGIEYIHESGICHRDLKPENLLLDFDKTLKIVDFGLSNMYEDGALLKTACGSPCYASPEMIQGKQYVGRKSDIWSSGVVLYAMVCGFLPFEDPKTSNLYKKILAADYEVPKFISDEFADFLNCIFQTDPEKRYDISEIRAHPWFKQQKEKQVYGQYPIKEKMPWNETVFNQVLAEFKYDRDYAIKCIEANRHNQVTACYHLIYKRNLKQSKISNDTYSFRAGSLDRSKQVSRSQRKAQNEELKDTIKQITNRGQSLESKPQDLNQTMPIPFYAQVLQSVQGGEEKTDLNEIETQRRNKQILKEEMNLLKEKLSIQNQPVINGANKNTIRVQADNISILKSYIEKQSMSKNKGDFEQTQNKKSYSTIQAQPQQNEINTESTPEHQKKISVNHRQTYQSGITESTNISQQNQNTENSEYNKREQTLSPQGKRPIVPLYQKFKTQMGYKKDQVIAQQSQPSQHSQAQPNFGNVQVQYKNLDNQIGKLVMSETRNQMNKTVNLGTSQITTDLNSKIRQVTNKSSISRNNQIDQQDMNSAKLPPQVFNQTAQQFRKPNNSLRQPANHQRVRTHIPIDAINELALPKNRSRIIDEKSELIEIDLTKADISNTVCNNSRAQTRNSMGLNHDFKIHTVTTTGEKPKVQRGQSQSSQNKNQPPSALEFFLKQSTNLASKDNTQIKVSVRYNKPPSDKTANLNLRNQTYKVNPDMPNYSVLLNKDEALLSSQVNNNNQKNSLNISHLYEHYSKQNQKKFQNANNSINPIPNNMNGQIQGKTQNESVVSRHSRALSLMQSNQFSSNQKQQYQTIQPSEIQTANSKMNKESIALPQTQSSNGRNNSNGVGQRYSNILSSGIVIPNQIIHAHNQTFYKR